MTEKFLKFSNSLILFVTGSVIMLSLMFPVFSHPDMGVLYDALIAFAGFMYVLSSKFLKEENRIETPIDGFLFIIFIFYIISALFARDVIVSFNSAVTFFALLLFYYIAFDFSKKYHRQFLILIISAAILLSAYALYQYFFGFGETLKYIKSASIAGSEAIKARIESRRVFSTFIYPNAFGGFLIMTIPVILGFMKNEKKLRWLSIPALILSAAALLMTRSYGSFISLIAAFGLVSFMLSDSSLKNFRVIYLLGLLVVTALFALALKLRGTADILSGISGRVESYIKMLSVAGKYIIHGAGPGSFESVYNAPGGPGAPYLKHAHNAVFQAAIELGIPALTVIISAIIFAYRAVVQNFIFSRTPQSKILIISLLTGITAFLIHNLIDFDIYNYALAMFFFFLLAILMSQVKIGLLQLKKIKLTYLLGINPGKRRTIIFYIISAILIISAITAGKHIIPYTALLSLAVAGFAIWSVSKEDIRRTSADIPAALLLAWFLITLTYTPDLYSGVSYYIMILSAAVIYYLFSQFLRRHNYVIAASNIIINTGIILSLTAVVQFIYRALSGAPAYADGFFPNRSLFAGYMAIPFSFMLSRFLLEKKIRLLWLKLASLVLFVTAVSLSSSKSGMLTLLAVFIAIWIYYAFNRPKIKDTAQRSSFKSNLMKYLAAFIILMSFTGISPSGEKVISVEKDPYYFNRLGIYGASLSMIKDSPVLGFGLGSFEKAFPPYNFPVSGISRYKHEPRFAHNELLQIAVVSGLPGLIIFLFLVFSLLRDLPSYKGHRKMWTAETGAYFALGGILFHSLFYFTLHVPGILFTASVAAAMVSREKYTISTIPKKSLFFTRIYYFPALILAFILFSSVIRPALARYMFDRYRSGAGVDYIEKAAQADPLNTKYTFEKGLFLEKSGMYKEALSLYEKALRFNRLDYITMLHAARCSMAVSDIKSAAKYYNDAVSANPYRAFTYSEIANFYASLGDFKSTESYLKKAVDTEPNFAEARRNLAVIYFNNGLNIAALEQYNKAEVIATELIPRLEYDRELVKTQLGLLYSGKALVLETMEKYTESCYYYRRAQDISYSPEIRKKIRSICHTEADK